MQQSKLRLEVKGYRAVNTANIQIGDITVLSGVNACGKSTLAHLGHTLVNLSRDYASLACDYAWRPVSRWILEYAKILVRLNRRLGVRLLITTHSPDMLNAIRRVANVEEVPDLHFYLAEEVSPKQKYDFDYLDLGRNVEQIFAKFNLAADRTESYPDEK